MGTVSDAVANGWLDALGNGVAYDNDEFWLKAHVGDPGSAGTNNAAAHTTRKQVSFATPSGRAMTSDAEVRWDDWSADETITWVSAWSASSGGTFLGSDQITSADMEIGDSLVLDAGDVDFSIP